MLSNSYDVSAVEDVNITYELILMCPNYEFTPHTCLFRFYRQS